MSDEKQRENLELLKENCTFTIPIELPLNQLQQSSPSSAVPMLKLAYPT